MISRNFVAVFHRITAGIVVRGDYCSVLNSVMKRCAKGRTAARTRTTAGTVVSELEECKNITLAVLAFPIPNKRFPRCFLRTTSHERNGQRHKNAESLTGEFVPAEKHVSSKVL